MSSPDAGNGARRGLAAALIATSVLFGCSPADEPTGDEAGAFDDARLDALLELGDPELARFTGDLDEMRERRVVRALVAPSRTDFFLDHGRIRGIQAELLHELEKFLNRDRPREVERIRVKHVPVAFGRLIPALEEGRGDLIAAFLTRTPDRNERVHFIGGLRDQVSEIVVTHRAAEVPASLEDLSGRPVYVLNGSSYVDHLRDLNDRLRAAGRPPVEIEEADARLEGEDILELVNSGVVETTIVDDYKARIWARVLDDIELHDDLALATGREVGWVVRDDSPQLARELERFTQKTRSGTLLGNMLFARYFEKVRWVDDPTSRAERDKLARYIELFEKYANRYGFEPLALAAQAYQESRLDQSKRSHRGAVGLMQILPSTARDPNVGIANIEEVEHNVHAGAKYMAFLRDRYFSDPELDGWNRTAFALAAYNAGPRKIREARAKAEKMGLDPNLWFDNVEVATGRSVGREPVRYVANIYKYYVAYRLLLDRRAERRSSFTR